MLKSLSNLNEDQLYKWVQDSVVANQHLVAECNQGTLLLYQNAGQRLIVKLPKRSTFIGWFHRKMLRHENEVYQRLQGIKGIPLCYGMLKDQSLVLEYVDGVQFSRKIPIENRNHFFDRLLEIIQELHTRRIAHCDLKKKDNLLIAAGSEPYLVDFGTAIMFKPGFHPINHYLYRLGVRFDLNSWVKHKYAKRFENVSEEDKKFYRRTWIERIYRNIKRYYGRAKRKLLAL